MSNISDAITVSNSGTGSAMVTGNPLPIATVSATTAIYDGSSATLSITLIESQPWHIADSKGHPLRSIGSDEESG